MKCHYREKKYICGNYTDVQIYPVYFNKKSRCRKTKFKPTSETQQRLNDENANRYLSRLINTNFTSSDLMITLTYSDSNQPTDELNAKKDIQNFLRRVKRRYKKLDIDLKYIWVLEQSKKTGRFHFHAVMNYGIDRTELEMLWGLGFANTRALQFTETGVEGLVKYYTKDKLLYRRYNASRNLKKPKERQNDNKISNKCVKALYDAAEAPEDFKSVYPDFEKSFPDMEIAKIEAIQNDYNGQLYFSVRLFNRKVVYGDKGQCAGLRNRSISEICSSWKTIRRGTES